MPPANLLSDPATLREPIYPLVGDPLLRTGSYGLPIMQQRMGVGSHHIGPDRNFMRTTVRPSLGVLGDSPGFPGHGLLDTLPFTSPFMFGAQYVANERNREYVNRPGQRLMDIGLAAIPGVLDSALVPAVRRAASGLYNKATGRLPMSSDELAALKKRMESATDVTPRSPGLLEAPVPVSRADPVPVPGGANDPYPSLLAANKAHVAPESLVQYDRAPVGGNPVGNIADPNAKKPLQSGARVPDPSTGRYADEPPVTWQGKPLENLNPQEVAEMGRYHGVDNLGPLSAPQTFKYTDGGTFEIPGGLDGKFTYLDLLKIRADAIDPSRITARLHTAIQKKLVNTMTPKVITDEHIFNAMLFGITSPNQPLYANQLAASRLRVRNRNDIARLAEFYPHPLMSKLSKEQKLQIDRKMAQTYGVQKGEDGGLGIKGSADYSNIAHLAKLYLEKPAFFRIGPSEPWPLFVDRISSQVPGMATKTASFGTVWPKANVAGTSAIDRHMALIFYEKFYRTKKAKAEAERVLSDRWAAAISQRRLIDRKFKGRTKSDEYKKAVLYLPSGKAKKVRGKNAILKQPGGEGFFTDHMLSQLGPRSSKLMRPNPNVGRSPMASLLSGTEWNPASTVVNPNVPESHVGIDWVARPDQIFMASPLYKRAMELNAEAAEKSGLSIFAEQWRKWDRQRRVIEPHENMFPGLEKMPKISHEQMRNVLARFKAQGVTDQQKVEYFDPDSGVLTQRLKPNRPLEGNPASLAYFDVAPGPLQRSYDPHPYAGVAATNRPGYPGDYNFKELPDGYARDKVAQWLASNEGLTGYGLLDDAEREAARRADATDDTRRALLEGGGTPSLKSRVDARLDSVRGPLGAWSLLLDKKGQLKPFTRPELLQMAEVLVDVLHVGSRGGLDEFTRGFSIDNPYWYHSRKLGNADLQQIPGLLLEKTGSGKTGSSIAPGYRQIGVNVDNVLAFNQRVRTDDRYQDLTAVERGLPHGTPEDQFMYVLTHEMGHAMHNSYLPLQDELRRSTSGGRLTNKGALTDVVQNILLHQQGIRATDTKAGTSSRRKVARELAEIINREGVAISRQRRPTQWAETEQQTIGIKTGHAAAVHEYLNKPQEILADVAATMLDNPASIANTEIYKFLKNMFGKGNYKDAIRFGAFGGLTLPQILMQFEENRKGDENASREW